MKTLLCIFLFCGLLKAQTLNYYYGNIHAHTSYSDGNKDSATSNMTTPIQDFNYARQSLQTDFYGISEHNHNGAGMLSPYYFNKGLKDADSANVDGQFVAMYGMEWGVISTGGHVLIYGFDSLCGWDFGNNEIYVPQTDYMKLWKTINRKQNTFAYLAHPQYDDYSNLFSQPVNAIADSAIIGMAMRSGPAFSTNNNYSNPSSSTYLARYNDALKQGYHIGVGLDHDTHNSVFDRQSAGRLVVMAPILNRQEIIGAFKRIRFYSSDDWNVKVDFKVNTMPMGSDFVNAGNPTIAVSITDPDGEATSLISVYYGVPGSGIAPTLLTSVNNSNTLNYTHNITDGSKYYYYLYVSQADGNKIWSSPIWYKRYDNSVIQTPTANFYLKANSGLCANNYFTLSDSSINNPISWWWTFSGADISNSSLQNPSIKYSAPGSYNVTLTVTNQIGVSSSISKTIVIAPEPTLSVVSADSICKGSSTNLLVTGCSSYLWNTGKTDSVYNIKPTINTTYTVVGFLDGCKISKVVKVKVYQAFQKPVISMTNDTLFSSYIYGNQWYLNSMIMQNENNSFLVSPPTGNYLVQVADTSGCISDFSFVYAYNNTSSIKSLDANLYFRIFPNPTKSILKISTDSRYENVEIFLIDEQGKIVVDKFVQILNSADVFQLNLDSVASGIYILKMSCNKVNYISKIKVE